MILYILGKSVCYALKLFSLLPGIFIWILILNCLSSIFIYYVFFFGVIHFSWPVHLVEC